LWETAYALAVSNLKKAEEDFNNAGVTLSTIAADKGNAEYEIS